MPQRAAECIDQKQPAAADFVGSARACLALEAGAVVVDHHGPPELVAPVHDPVSDSVKLGHVVRRQAFP